MQRKIRKITIPIKNNTKQTIEKVNKDKLTKINKNPNNIQNKVNMFNSIQNKHTKILSTIDPIWKGETVYIIGGGPSLKQFNFSLLDNKNTIVINKGFYSYPNADILYWTDGRFYTWYKDDIDNFKGTKVTITPGTNTLTDDIKMLKRGNRLGLEISPNTLAHGNNSGYAAINLAYHLGAKRIILLGYDMGNDGINGHFHEGYPTNKTQDKIYQNQFIPSFDSLAPLLKNAKVEVINANLHSRLTCFKKMKLEDALVLI